ncbi:MAG TPA: succinyl-diaminopimelate desuccinylase [Gaiellaceae bacterium]|nr:succinyl-diaminopimelate desuccinylase [Gaiellaceae bacterium]
MALADRTLDLVNIASVSGNEAEAYAYIKANVPLETVFDDGETLLYAKRSGKPLVLLAGHLDTVPEQGNRPGRIEDGWIVGLGASDMKGGVAVMVELGRWAAEQEPAYDLGLLFFPREELGPEHNPLPSLFAQAPMIDEAELVICLEPTDNQLHLGCLGNLSARVVYEGKSAHSARPWTGENAIAKALHGLEPILDLAPRDVEIEGLVFREVISVVQLHAGIANNVIPARAEAILNFRYAPDRTPEEAEARVRELVGENVEFFSNSAAAHVAPRDGIVGELARAGGFEFAPKQAWTNVADFAARGLDAVNLGPGATRYAHAVDERVEIAALERTYEALQSFLAGTVQT